MLTVGLLWEAINTGTTSSCTDIRHHLSLITREEERERRGRGEKERGRGGKEEVKVWKRWRERGEDVKRECMHKLPHTMLI